jgi:hypothetical protein
MLNILINAPSDTRHSFATPSAPPDASMVASGEKAKDITS